MYTDLLDGKLLIGLHLDLSSFLQSFLFDESYLHERDICDSIIVFAHRTSTGSAPGCPQIGTYHLVHLCKYFIIVQWTRGHLETSSAG